MSKIKLLTVAVIGLLLINIAIVCFLFLKRPHQPLEGMRPPLDEAGPKNIIIERLHFDKAQVAAYEELIKAHQSSVRVTNDSIRLLKQALYQTLSNETFAGKDSIINKLTYLQNKIEHLHYNHFIELKKLCSPNQQKDFNELTKELARLFAPLKNIPLPPKD